MLSVYIGQKNRSRSSAKSGTALQGTSPHLQQRCHTAAGSHTHSSLALSQSVCSPCHFSVSSTHITLLTSLEHPVPVVEGYLEGSPSLRDALNCTSSSEQQHQKASQYTVTKINIVSFSHGTVNFPSVLSFHR